MRDTAQFRRKLVRTDMERMNLPEEYWFVKVDGVPGSVRSKVRRYMTRFDRMYAVSAGLLLLGPEGVGKTTISAVIAKEARCRGYTVLFIRLWELREMIRARIGYNDDLTISQRVREVDVLVLDDLREEDASEKFFTLAEIVELIKYRRGRCKITIVTSQVASMIASALKPFVVAMQGILVPFVVDGPNLYESRHEELSRAVLGD